VGRLVLLVRRLSTEAELSRSQLVISGCGCRPWDPWSSSAGSLGLSKQDAMEIVKVHKVKNGCKLLF